MQQVQQNDGAFFAVCLAENSVQILEWALSNGDRCSFTEKGHTRCFQQASLQFINYGIRYCQRLVCEGDHAQHSARGAYAVPVVRNRAQVDEKVTGKQWLLHDAPLPVSDLFNRMLGAVTGKMLVAKVLFSSDFLSRLALNKVPACCGRVLCHCYPLSSRDV